MSLPMTKGLEAVSANFVAGRPEDVQLENAPINPDWVVSGAPRARAGMHSPSVDGRTATHIWECTAGSFWWTFNDEETVVILDGAVQITTEDGQRRMLKSGDIAYFAQDSRALWEIETHVRKIAFCKRKFSPQVLALRSALGKLKRGAKSGVAAPGLIAPLIAMLPL